MEERLQFTESTAYLMNPQPFASSSTSLPLNTGFGAKDHCFLRDVMDKFAAGGFSLLL